MGGYVVDPVELQACDPALRAACERSRQALAQVRSSADALHWVGVAGAAFRLGWHQWLGGAETMLDALDCMAAALGASAQGYVSTEETVRTAISRAAM